MRRSRAAAPALLVLALVLIVPGGARAAGTELWALSFGGSGSDLARGIAVTADGGLVLGGSFPGKAAFGGDQLTSAGSGDLFVASFNAAREHVWSVRGGGPRFDSVQDLALLPGGDTVATGSFVGRATIGGASLTGDGREMFLARFAAADGTTTWAIARGGARTDHATDIAVNADGDVFVTGYFTGTADFGGGGLTSDGDKDIFVAKYDGDDGRHLWSRRFGANGADIGNGLAVNAGGDVFVTGRFSDTVRFGASDITASGRGDPFVARLSGGNGSPQWARALPATGSANGRAVAVDADGDVFVTGYFYGTTDFGARRTSAGGRDLFLAKVAGGNGALVWSRTGGGIGHDTGFDLAVDPGSDVVVVGTFARTAALGGPAKSSEGGSDLFVAIYDGAEGGPVWVAGRGSSGHDQADALDLTASGDPVVAGWVGGTARFGEQSLSNAGGADALAAAFSGDNGAPAATITTPANSVLMNVGQSTLVVGTATDDRIGVATVDVSFGAPAGAVEYAKVAATLSCEDERRACTWSAQPPVHPGPMQVTVTTTDRAGNTSTGPSILVINV